MLFKEREFYKIINNKDLLKLVSCRSKIGINSITKCIKDANNLWKIESIDDNDLISNRESICCAQWDSYQCRNNLAKNVCNNEENEVMVKLTKKAIIMNEKTLCSEYKYDNNKCHSSLF